MTKTETKTVPRQAVLAEIALPYFEYENSAEFDADFGGLTPTQAYELALDLIAEGFDVTDVAEREADAKAEAAAKA
jgi:hypothetical protein